jgi:hypothetical protein
MLTWYIVALIVIQIIEVFRIINHNSNVYSVIFSGERGFAYWIGTLIGNAFWLGIIFVVIKLIIWALS